MTRSLHLCRTETEACSAAASAAPPGLVLSVLEDGGGEVARVATATILGPVDRTYHQPDERLLASIVVDTLQNGESDVFAAVPEWRGERLAELASAAGFRVARPSGPCPAAVDQPFSLLAAARRRADVTVGPDGAAVVGSFCKMFVDTHPAVAPGDAVRMEVFEHDDGCDVFYVDDQGEYLGLHGRLPYALPDEAVERLGEVRAKVDFTSWGREWRDGVLVPVQTLVFNIPADVDSMLADARLPRPVAPLE